MKATTLLESQHRNLEQVCEAVERGSASMRESLLPQLAGDLVAHLAVEELLFYPTVATLLREQSWLRESRSRGAKLRQMLERLLDCAPDCEAFVRAVALLRETLASHSDNQEATLFPRVDAALDAKAMRELAYAMMALYHVQVEAGYKRDRGLSRGLPHSASVSPSR